MTLALGLQSFISDQFAAHWTLFSAAAVISSLPIMIVFMCLQRFIQNGLVAGGVKDDGIGTDEKRRRRSFFIPSYGVYKT